MKSSLARHFGLATILFCCMAPTLLRAQDKPLKDEPKVEGRRGLWQRIGLSRAPGEREKSHENVTGAFREILAQPSKATVRTR